MRFTKMHGLGNDYVYVDGFQQAPPAEPAALAPRISDRHRGVGADGLILILPSTSADARMRMFNADGSESEMCGNGIRCVAKYIHDHGIATKPQVTIETARGILALDITAEEGKARWIRVDMGEPILQAAAIPTTFTMERVVDLPLPESLGPWQDAWMEASGLDPRMTCVSMGNPHLVLYCQNVAEVPLAEVGPILEHAAIFPRRINVHFVEVLGPREAIMRTWERGSGITQACGTGACAVCVAGVLTQRTERDLLAHLPGGDLKLSWNPADQHVFMTGPATEVFSGDWPDA